MNKKELIKKQKKLCKNRDIPMFAPEDGVCWSCKKNTVNERWAKEHQTGCSICNRSWCD